MTKQSTVSIIVSTKNEGEVVGECLRSISSQSYKNIEIIIIDNASSDNTCAIARTFTRKVFQKAPERSAQRNYGAKKAGGTYLFFVDADMILDTHVVRDCVSHSEKQKGTVKSIIVPEESFGRGFWASCKALERSYYVGVPWIEAARFFDRQAFESIGGYDEGLTGPEDWDLHRRMKDAYGASGIGRISSYIHHDEGMLRLSALLRKKFYYAKTIGRYEMKIVNREYFRHQASIADRYALFLSKPTKIIRYPHMWVGMIFLKTLEFTAGGMGYISRKFIKL